MSSPVATTAHDLPLPKPHAPSQHQYGTRIRSNSVIKPSIRLRQASDMQRRIKPVPVPKPQPAVAEPPDDMPAFPPPQVMLHADDANNKVFHAIGRSFMSVNNQAMTIKDLAEMTMKFGLMCQNVSAAGQAITTYIRNHIQRCEDQQDQPLLLRHVLSGTPSDDDLVPALHSRTGGAHCMLNPTGGRVTNFRRGTMVWYLSKAAGVPCPFARAGIRLSNYGENGKTGTAVNPSKERKRARDRMRRAEQCGQKRKRPMRSCAAKAWDSESSEDERPAPKVKLTLRLNPSLVSRSSASPSASRASSEVIDLSRNSSESEDSDDNSMSVDSDSSDSSDSEDSIEEASWSLPAYPKPAVSSLSHALSVDHPNSAALLPTTPPHDRYWRSPSVPSSAVSASPPPDSPDEDDDFHPSLKMRYTSESSWPLEDDDDFFADMEENDTQWGESPGPVSPPAQFDDEGVTVKQEPRDVGGLLDAWEELDGGVAGLRVVDGETFQPKLEDIDSWAWNDSLGVDVTDSLIGAPEYIKTEDDEPRLMFGDYSPLSPLVTSSSPLSYSDPSCILHNSPDDAYLEARRRSESVWKDAETLGPDSVKLQELDEGVWNLDPCRQEPKETCQTLPVNVGYAFARECSLSSRDAQSDTSEASFPQSSPSEASRTSLTVPSDKAGEAFDSTAREVILYQTAQPCVHAICATDLEGVMVYQMVLGSSLILRRVDTDFVNISPILQFFGMDQPDSSLLSNSVAVTRGNSLVCGTWTRLSTAQDLFCSHSFLNNFLSDNLHERFAGPFRTIRQKAMSATAAVGFGPHFQSTANAKRESTSSFQLELPPRSVRMWELGLAPQWEVEDHLLSVHPPFALCSAAVPSSHDDIAIPETPLSPTEEAMFRVLCTAADWEPSATVDVDEVPAEPCLMEMEAGVMEPELPVTAVVPVVAERLKERERPLRRSKRVAIAAAASRPRTRSVAKKRTRSSRS